MLVVHNLEGLIPTSLLPLDELEKECHGDEENIDGWLLFWGSTSQNITLGEVLYFHLQTLTIKGCRFAS
jgi:hypothetical protein